MFDLGGRIILQDAFSTTLDSLTRKSGQATEALDRLDDATTIEKPQRAIKSLNSELDRLRAKGRAGTLTLMDVSDFQKAQGALRTLQGGLDEIKGKGQQTNFVMQNLKATIASMAVGFGAMQLLRAGSEMVKLGSDASALGEALDGLSRRAGVDGRAIVEEIRTASDGTISSIQAMQAVNRQFLSDNQELAAKIPDLFRVADASAKALGMDVGQTFESIISAISSGQTRQLRSIGLYIDSTAAMETYAQSIGKTTSQLTLADKQMALFNATMTAGIPLIEATGSASADASDEVASFGVAIGELKRSMGELAVESGAANAVGKLADFLGRAAAERDAENNLKGIVARLREIGQEDAAARLESQMDAATLAMYRVWLSTGSAAKASAVYREELNRLAGEQERYLALASDEERWSRMVAAQRARESDVTVQATEAQDAFNETLTATRDKLTGISTLAGDLGGLVGALEGLSAGGALEMPSLGGTALTTDTAALRDYLAELARIQPELAPVIAETSAHVSALAQQQSAVIMAATAAGDFTSGLTILATEAFGAGAGILDLVNKFDQLSPMAQSAALSLGLTTLAISELRRQANEPVSLQMNVSGFERGLQQIDQFALRLAKVTDPEQARTWRDAAQRSLETNWITLGKTDKFGQELLLQNSATGWDVYVKQFEDAGKKAEKVLQDHNSRLAQQAGEVRSQIEGALRAGLEVTPADMAAADAGTYKEKALEAARQLDAVAQRGFAELQAHPDWAALLKIPPDVLNGSEAVLKAWAAQTQQQVENLARPDLINWDAFVANFQQAQQDAAAQELTIDIALGKLDEAGLLGGRSQEQAREDVKQALGLGEPQITFESYFAPAEGETPQAVVDRAILANGIPTMPVEYAGQQAAGETTGAAPVTPSATRPEAVAPLTAPDMDTTGFGKNGADLAGQLYASYEAAVKAQDVGLVTAGYWAADFAANAPQFFAIGTSMGTLISGALVTALEKGVGDVRRRIAELVAPEVATILAAQRGPLP